MQAKLIARMIALAEAGLPDVTEKFTNLQDSELRVDIVRAIWLEQMADTERLLTAFESVAGVPDSELATA